MTTSNQTNKRAIWNLWQRLDLAEQGDLQPALSDAFHKEIAWFGPEPINELEGVDAVVDGYWLPLLNSFPDVRRETQIFLGGSSGEDEWIAAMGYLNGTFARDWLGIPANGKLTHIHFGQFYAMREGRAAESYLILDIPAVMRQAGFDVLPPSRGRVGGKIPGPTTNDGVLLEEHDRDLSTRTARVIENMGKGLQQYNRERDGSDLSSMEHHKSWQPDMEWHGPTGIGSCHSIEEFMEFHQGPWLKAFGDRGTPLTSGRAIALTPEDFLAEGNYGALGVWDAPFSINHDDYLDIPATGKMTTMRDFDWYRVADGLIAQNWVPLDMIDLLGQLGVDVFALLAEQVEERRNKAWFE